MITGAQASYLWESTAVITELAKALSMDGLKDLEN